MRPVASRRADLACQAACLVAALAVRICAAGMILLGAGLASRSPAVAVVGAGLVALACVSIVAAAVLHIRLDPAHGDSPG